VVEREPKQVETHLGFWCDICRKDNITGPRYHCSVCENYDVCNGCHSQGKHRIPITGQYVHDVFSHPLIELWSNMQTAYVARGQAFKDTSSSRTNPFAPNLVLAPFFGTPPPRLISRIPDTPPAPMPRNEERFPVRGSFIPSMIPTQPALVQPPFSNIPPPNPFSYQPPRTQEAYGDIALYSKGTGRNEQLYLGQGKFGPPRGDF
jgi:hypothetical protein